MFKVDLNFQLKSLSGKEIDGENGHAGKLLAQAMYHSNTGKSLKFSLWAEKFYQSEKVEMDDSDITVLSEWVEAYGTNPQQQGLILPHFTDGLKAQIIRKLKDVQLKANGKSK